MLASRLRHTVTIQRATEGARDTYGVPAQTWSDLATVRAWVQPNSRSESDDVTQGGPVDAGFTAFMLPTDVRESDRLRWGAGTYQVRSVTDPAGKGHHLELDLRLVVAP